jgi:A/G-specific adenine glycosylase
VLSRAVTARVSLFPNVFCLVYLQLNSSLFSSMSPKQFIAIRRKLLRWYDSGHRDLPWRRTADPYAIWVAETMLQQTQVTTVVPYYQRFLERFPTIKALARAPLRHVLALWSGLGYYRRAENLKKSARELILNYRGRLPDDHDTLLSLPGIGEYTAGALMSIAFGQAYPALDGNARRALGRIFRLSSQAELRKLATRLVPKTRPAAFNQAVMELGARICVPKTPRCPQCPVALHCRARRDHPALRSAAPRPKVLKEVFWPLVIVRRNGKYLLRRRSGGGMLAGLWEFPGGAENNDTARAALKYHLREVTGNLGRHRRIGAVHHTITNKKIHAPIFLIDVAPHAEIRLANSNWRWVAPSSLRHYPVSSMTLKAAKLLTRQDLWTEYR